MSSGKQLAAAIKSLAQDAGFMAVGIASTQADLKADAFARWIEKGFHAGMAYMARDVATRHRPTSLMDGARSVICLAVSYAPTEDLAGGAFIARYARGRDYHRVLKKRAHRLMDCIREIEPGFEGRAFVDAGPIAERSLAAAAGLGWIGRNGCLIVPGLGSYVVLCEVVCNLSLPADEPVASRCGDCDKCIQACPTGALHADGLLDARRCRSYLTIEHRGEIDPKVGSLMGNCVFGCDVCQEVCPQNRSAPPGDAEITGPRDALRELSAHRVLDWTEADWDAATRGSTMRRATYEMWVRNARMCRGNPKS